MRYGYKAVSRPAERVNSVTRTSRNSESATTIERTRTKPRLDYTRLDSERQEGRKEGSREPTPRRMTVILDWQTYRALLRFQANFEEYRGPGHAIGQLAKAKLADLNYLYEKSPLEDVQTAYGRGLRVAAEREKALLVKQVREDWAILGASTRAFHLERFPSELSDLPAPTAEQVEADRAMKAALIAKQKADRERARQASGDRADVDWSAATVPKHPT